MRWRREDRQQSEDSLDLPAEEWLREFRPVRPDALTSADGDAGRSAPSQAADWRDQPGGGAPGGGGRDFGRRGASRPQQDRGSQRLFGPDDGRTESPAPPSPFQRRARPSPRNPSRQNPSRQNPGPNPLQRTPPQLGPRREVLRDLPGAAPPLRDGPRPYQGQPPASRQPGGSTPHPNSGEYLSGRVLPPAQGYWDDRGVYQPDSGQRAADPPQPRPEYRRDTAQRADDPAQSGPQYRPGPASRADAGRNLYPEARQRSGGPSRRDSRSLPRAPGEPLPGPGGLQPRRPDNETVLPSGLFGSPNPRPPALSGGYPGPRPVAIPPGDGFGQVARDDVGRQQLPPPGRPAGSDLGMPPERGFGAARRPASGEYREQLPQDRRYELPDGRHALGSQAGGAGTTARPTPRPAAPRAYTFPDEPSATRQQPAQPDPSSPWRLPAEGREHLSRASDLAPLASPAPLPSPTGALDAGPRPPRTAPAPPVPENPDDDTQTSPLPVILPGATELPRPAPVENPRGFFAPARPVSPAGSVEPPPNGQQTPEPPRQMPEEAAAKLDQIKDLYLTADAIGEDALDMHFDQVSQRQRELIEEFFRNSAPGGSRPAQ